MAQLKPAERAAYHEAGHVLAYLHTGRRVRRTYIKQVEGGEFEGKTKPVKGQQQDLMGCAIILAAGMAAECVLTGKWPEEPTKTDPESDFIGLEDLSNSLFNQNKDDAAFYRSWAKHCAWLLLKEPVVVTPMLHAIADALMERKGLAEQEVLEICRQVGKDTGKGLPRWQVFREGE